MQMKQISFSWGHVKNAWSRCLAYNIRLNSSRALFLNSLLLVLFSISDSWISQPLLVLFKLLRNTCIIHLHIDQLFSSLTSSSFSTDDQTLRIAVPFTISWKFIIGEV